MSTIGVAVSTIGGMRSYFWEYSPRRIYGDINGIVATDLGYDAAAEMGASARMYFFGAPRMYGDFPTIRYLAPATESVDILDPLQQPPAPGFALPDKDAVFVFLPERLAELRLVQQTYPHGTLRFVTSPVSPDNLFTLYRVPRAFLGIPSGQVSPVLQSIRHQLAFDTLDARHPGWYNANTWSTRPPSTRLPEIASCIARRSGSYHVSV